MSLEEMRAAIGLELSWIDSSGIVSEHAHLGAANGWEQCRASLQRVWDAMGVEL